MTSIPFPPDLLALFKVEGVRWVDATFSGLYPSALPLPQEECDLFRQFVPGAILRRVRVTMVPAIPNPHFYSALEAQGTPVPLDFRVMAGITFRDLILVSKTRADLSGFGLRSLLFHELVHVVQYDCLGTTGFLERYVDGWAGHGYRYDQIPLERQAYSLQERFNHAPTTAFSVHAEVMRAFPKDRERSPEAR